MSSYWFCQMIFLEKQRVEIKYNSCAVEEACAVWQGVRASLELMCIKGDLAQSWWTPEWCWRMCKGELSCWQQDCDATMQNDKNWTYTTLKMDLKIKMTV